ncbi:MAG TPA: YciI family protein [Saprospiraceae bacterium]|nr:YciI family protein [Saprospiraceae bacterium]
MWLLLAGVSLNAQKINEQYDSTLAKKYGANEYGMKSYVLVLLKTGSVVEDNKPRRDSLFDGHMKNINRLASEGKLVVAGPLAKNDKYRGIFILDTGSLEEAQLLLETDPAIHAKLLEPELYRWFGSAALPAYLELDAKVGKFKF